MKNKDLERLQRGLAACKDLTGVKFVVAVAKNARLLAIVLGDLQKGIEQDDSYGNYEKARIALCEKYAARDEGGGAKMNESKQQFILQDPFAFTKAVNKLRESDEHKESVDRHEVRLVEYKVLMEEEADYTPFTIPEDCLPKELTAGQLQDIFEIVQEN